MLESKQIVTYDDPSNIFIGVRFVLLGFDSIKKEKVRLKLLEGGGIDAVNYAPDCSHVIVDKLVYDDPICVAARRDDKILVNGLWVDHSFDVGMPVDPSSVMYRPMKDLNGIPGAKSLVLCLTGYQRQDRDDIMTMVALMGATFSKPLVANKVTHLICYKFEGEKYELAKKMKKIKLVNHHWLEDCLKAWELLPESDYDKSAFELEMMAEAKDSEEETEDVATTIEIGRQNVVSPQNTRVVSTSFHHTPSKPLVSRNNLQLSASKSLANDGEIHSTPGREVHDKHFEIPSPFKAKSLGKISPEVPSNMLDGTNISENSPDADVSKLSSKSKFKSTPLKPTCPLRPESNFGIPSSSNVNKLGVAGGFDVDCGGKTPLKETLLPDNEGQTAIPPNKSKTTVSRGSSKSSVLSRDIGDEGQTAKSPNKSKTTVSRGGSKSPTLNLDCGGRTPLKGTSLPGDEGKTVKSPDKSKTTVSRGSLKSPTSSHDPKILMESELVTKPVDYLSGPAKDALRNSRKRLKLQTLPNLDVKELSSVRTNNPSSGVDIRQSENVQRIELPFEMADSGIENMDGQDDPKVINEGNMGAQLKPLKRKLLDKKTLGSKRTISKASTTKLKGTLNLQKEITQNANVICSNREVAIGDADNAATEDDETQAPKVENEFIRGNNNEQCAEVEAPHLGKGDINSEKEETKENGNEAEKAVSSKKIESIESKAKSSGGEKKIAKGKKRSLAKANKNKSKDSGEEVKNDENKTCSGNEETVTLAGKTKTRPSKKLKKSSDDVEKENEPATGKKPLKNGFLADKRNLDSEKDARNTEVKAEPAWFILSGHRLQRKDFQQLIRRLKGRVCRDSHHWSYQATHFIVPDPVKRTEKFFAAAASGSWILKTDYLTASNEAGRLLSEEPYEWHKKCLTEDGAINLEAPRKWRLLREKTGHGAFYGMRIVIYGECIAPPLDTLKRAIKAGDGTILATSPPYTRFFGSGIDFAIVSPGMPRVDMWVQEFLRHEIPCVVADYLVEYVCKPGYSLERHVQYNTHSWAAKSLENLKNRAEEVVEDVRTPQNDDIDDVACRECGSRDRGEEMLICGDESGSCGCGVGVHFDCLDPPLDGVPEEDWFCKDCRVERESKKSVSKSSKKRVSKSKK